MPSSTHFIALCLLNEVGSTMTTNPAMHVLTEDEFQHEVEPTLKRVLPKWWGPGDGLEELFTPEITARMILFPCWQGGIIDCLPIKVLADAALKIGDTGCYIFPWWNGPSNYCYVPLSELAEGYDGEPFSGTLIHARIGVDPYCAVTTIVSSEGNWGLYTSSAHHALIGGSPEFIEELRRGVRDIDNQVYEFFEFWQENWQEGLLKGHNYGPYRWLPILLKHIYGEEKGTQLLHESGLPWE
jgi:hypothetical protein